MQLRIDRSHAQEQGPDEALHRAQQEYLDALRPSVAASRALLVAGPGERNAAHRAFMDATRRQADAERAYERLRQQARGSAYTGRPRMSRYG